MKILAGAEALTAFKIKDREGGWGIKAAGFYHGKGGGKEKRVKAAGFYHSKGAKGMHDDAEG